MLLRLRTFGGLWIEGPDADPAVAPRPRSLALLVLCAAAGAKGVSRERALGVLWPESHPERARHALSQTLYTVRREVGGDVIVSSPDLRLDPRLITSDIDDFTVAIRAKQWGDAAALYVGDFLDGFYLSDAPEFERWVDEQRSLFAADAARALEATAQTSIASGKTDEAIDELRRLTRLDPANSRYAAKYMEALAAAGDRAGAVAYGKAHLDLLQREFDLDPDSELERMIARVREAVLPASVQVARPAVIVDSPLVTAPPPQTTHPDGSVPTPLPVRRRGRGWWRVGVGAAVLLAVAAITAITRSPSLHGSAAARPVLAVGWFRDLGATDSVGTGRVSGDMLATSLARVSDLQVIATSRMLELAPRNADTSRAGLTTAARRAGAAEIIEGEFVPLPDHQLELDVRRVNLARGLVRGGYRVTGSDRVALLDSVTTLIALDLGVRAPYGSAIQVSTRSAVAFRLYEEGLRSLFQFDAPAAGRLFRAALREDSTFALAAYYAWRAGVESSDPLQNKLADKAMALAPTAPPRDRLLIVTHVGFGRSDVRVLASAETLATRYPHDPEALIRAGEVVPDLAQSVRLVNAAIALDSAAGVGDGAICRLCDALYILSWRYEWADSDAAVRRTFKRWSALRPNDAHPWALLADWLVGFGHRAPAEAAQHRYATLGGAPADDPRLQELVRNLRFDEFDLADETCARALASADSVEFGTYRWYCAIGLRMEGRFAEARALNEGGRVPRSSVMRRGTVPDPFIRAILDFETGRSKSAEREYLEVVRTTDSAARAGDKNPRLVPWFLTLAATAAVGGGDTAFARQLVDSIEIAGSRSVFPRDPLLHHFVRGLLYSRARQHDAALHEFRAALSSPTFGYTRINYEIGKTLLALHRPAEGIQLAQAALHGGIEGSGLYVTRTEFHELLAQLFDAAGQPDSAAGHYAVVARAWRSADALLADRQRAAAQRSGRVNR